MKFNLSDEFLKLESRRFLVKSKEIIDVLAGRICRMISPVVINRNILTSGCSAIWFARGVEECGSYYQQHKDFLSQNATSFRM